RSQPLRLPHPRLVVLVEHHLRDARAVTDVDEQQSAEVADPMDPAQENDVRADILRTQGAARVGACQLAELFSHGPSARQECLQPPPRVLMFSAFAPPSFSPSPFLR